MNKKILIGSIAAVFILVAVFVAPVIGSSVSISAVKKGDSPLFSARTASVVEKDSGTIQSTYVGQGEMDLTIALSETYTIDGQTPIITQGSAIWCHITEQGGVGCAITNGVICGIFSILTLPCHGASQQSSELYEIGSEYGQGYGLQ